VKRSFFFAIGVVVLGACSDSDPVALHERIYEAEGATRTFQGGGCVIYDFGTGTAKLSTSGGSASLAVLQSLEDDVIVVTVMDGMRKLITRRYDRSFLDSSTRDEFSVTSARGQRYVLQYWGTPFCDSEEQAP
jgi:hypothetical protein